MGNELPIRELIQELFNYNPETGELIWKYRPNQRGGSFNQLYANTIVDTTSFHVQVYKKNYAISRVCWLHYYGEPVPDLIDHIDGNVQNNKPSNWRAATRSQNNANQRIRKDNVSGFKGITTNKYGRFLARVQHQGIEYSKTFKTIKEAIEWRRTTYEHFFQEFVKHK